MAARMLSMRLGVAVVLALVGRTAAALGLGDLAVYTPLGEPFYGEIRVFDDGHTPDPKCLQLNRPTDHDGVPTMPSAKLVLVQGPVVVVTSSEPVRSPVVRLDISIGCSNRVSRQYNVLLDPPGLARLQPRPAPRPEILPELLPTPTPAVTPAPKSQAVVAPAPEARPEPRPEESLEPLFSTGGGEGVSIGDQVVLPSGRRVKADLKLEPATRLQTPVAASAGEQRAMRDAYQVLEQLNKTESNMNRVLEAAARGEPLPADVDIPGTQAVPASTTKPKPVSVPTPVATPSAVVAPQEEGWGLWTWVAASLGVVVLVLVAVWSWMRGTPPKKVQQVVPQPESYPVDLDLDLIPEGEEAKESAAQDYFASTDFGFQGPVSLTGMTVAELEPSDDDGHTREPLPDLEFDHDEAGLALEEPVYDAEQLLEVAEVMLAFGRVGSATETLQELVEERPKEAVEPWLRLLRVYYDAGMREQFDELSGKINPLFNVQTPQWEDFVSEARGSETGLEEVEYAGLTLSKMPLPGASGPQAKASLEDFPHIAASLQELWGRAECVAYLDRLLRDNRDGLRQGFSLPIAEEIVLLKRMAADKAAEARRNAFA